MGNDISAVDGRDTRHLIADGPGRIDSALAAACSDLSRARIQRLIADGLVQVNGTTVRKSVQVAAGDLLDLTIPAVDHLSGAAPVELPILYEDDLVVVIDKPAGIAVHGGPDDTSSTVATWFVQRYPAEAAKFDAERPGIVHRLDKDTTGVLVMAKTPAAQAALSLAFAERETEKQYIAVCDGVPARDRAVVEADIGRHPGDRTRMAISRHGRAARTDYVVVASDKEHSLLLVHPLTGRTHQIRVHLAAVGIPVSCDRIYGKAGATRQLLHAWRLSLPHPAGGTLTVTAPLPADMLEAVREMGAEQEAAPYSVATTPARTEDPV
jgi:23S rRNA pseudouridine1911/1915/1917 synthase